MATIKSYYPLIHVEAEDDFHFLFLSYYNNIILKDDYLSQVYFQIDRYLKRMTVKNNILYIGSKCVDVEELAIPDRLGQLRSSKIIKQMKSTKHVYEVRINEEYMKHRLLLFPLDLALNNINIPSLLFTFGFSKEKDSKDVTQIFTDKTQVIRDNLYSGIFNESIIGKELNNEL